MPRALLMYSMLLHLVALRQRARARREPNTLIPNKLRGTELHRGEQGVRNRPDRAAGAHLVSVVVSKIVATAHGLRRVSAHHTHGAVSLPARGRVSWTAARGRALLMTQALRTYTEDNILKKRQMCLFDCRRGVFYFVVGCGSRLFTHGGDGGGGMGRARRVTVTRRSPSAGTWAW